MDTIQCGVSEHHHAALLDTHFGLHVLLRETSPAQQTEVHRVLSADHAGLCSALSDLIFHDRHHRRFRTQYLRHFVPRHCEKSSCAGIGRHLERVGAEFPDQLGAKTVCRRVRDSHCPDLQFHGSESGYIQQTEDAGGVLLLYQQEYPAGRIL
ncbi:hypothetical protein SDC9_122081 [bioreactor metagenome]|uniref:Uncharacterized protein n=1 Tax=bioreactor metagenome TaxID=1076179 RepID=A0A645CDU5_9ZZZZ